MLPSVDKSMTHLFLKREIQDDKITVYLESGDSYYLKPEQVVVYLKLHDFSDPQGAVDFCWNFYSVAVDFISGLYQSVNKEDLLTMIKSIREESSISCGASNG